MTCKTCTRPKTVTLENGQQCCTYCEQHKAECLVIEKQARNVLALPDKQSRRSALDKIEQPRRSRIESVVLNLHKMRVARGVK